MRTLARDRGDTAKVRAVTTGLPHPARSDARDNRELILEAARTVFTADGMDAPLREVARRAGVGPATVYRHFPSKRDLAVEAFSGRMNACHTVVDAALADPDPWRGFVHVVEEICELHARDRGVVDAFVAAFPDAFDFAALRGRALASVAELMRRARQAGRLRADFTVEDLVLVIMANQGIRTTSVSAGVAASRRFAALAVRASEAA